MPPRANGHRPPSGAGLPAPAANGAPVDPADVAELIEAWPALPAPLPVTMLDGYLAGVLLQRRPVPLARWWPQVFEGESAAASRADAGPATEALRDALRRRHAELEAAIAGRRWFDPWVFEPEDGAVLRDALFPWVAGFAHAMASFEDLGDTDDPAFDEPLALLYQHLDPDDLEDADTLLEVIEALPAPEDLAEGVEQLVRATLLIADETRPRPPGRRDLSRA